MFSEIFSPELFLTQPIPKIKSGRITDDEKNTEFVASNAAAQSYPILHQNDHLFFPKPNVHDCY